MSVNSEAGMGACPSDSTRSISAEDQCVLRIVIVIATGEVFAGSLPSRALRLVREWLDEHRDELVANWERARAGQPVSPVAPLR